MLSLSCITGTAPLWFYFIHCNFTVKLYDCKGNFIYSLIKVFLWSAVSSFGFPLQWKCRCTGVCPGKVVCGSMWWWVTGSWEEGSCCCLQVLVRVQSSHSGSWRCTVIWQEAMGPGLKKANNAHILGKWKGRTNWHHEHLFDWRYSLSNVQNSCLMKLTQHQALDWTRYLNMFLWVCIILWFLSS